MPRILLVDYDKDHLELFTMILENEGYSVDAYADPDTALSKFRPNYYDLFMAFKMDQPFESEKLTRVTKSKG